MEGIFLGRMIIMCAFSLLEPYITVMTQDPLINAVAAS